VVEHAGEEFSVNSVINKSYVYQHGISVLVPRIVCGMKIRYLKVVIGTRELKSCWM
jgi:hypothetical protein